MFRRPTATPNAATETGSGMAKAATGADSRGCGPERPHPSGSARRPRPAHRLVMLAWPAGHPSFRSFAQSFPATGPAILAP
ncbi:hypothetical protein GCM10010345_94080 [Streptomyces canarius]|uniref:Uncharacterized protein n=1 Tax=Streptomyces canarius TaxID=285453 RepID=A0ABQ3DC28_9ACTN|nr:hypothetical protein GCM10010345_94080 [Streptomyces canarius]